MGEGWERGREGEERVCGGDGRGGERSVWRGWERRREGEERVCLCMYSTHTCVGLHVCLCHTGISSVVQKQRHGICSTCSTHMTPIKYA